MKRNSNEIITKAARSLGLPTEYVEEVYRTYWAFVRHYFSTLKLKEDITKEEFLKLKTSVNIPSLGKMFIDWEYLQAKKKENERYKDKSDSSSIHNNDNNS